MTTGAASLTQANAKPADHFITKPVFLHVISEDHATASVGLSRKAGESSIDANGTIVQLVLLGMNALPDAATINLDIANVYANDINGNPM